jgi:hypothetical protein
MGARLQAFFVLEAPFSKIDVPGVCSGSTSTLSVGNCESSRASGTDSILNESTGNLKLAQKLLGHSTVNMTANVYMHTSAEAEREAALAIGRAVYGDLFPVVPNWGNTNSNEGGELGMEGRAARLVT